MNRKQKLIAVSIFLGICVISIPLMRPFPKPNLENQPSPLPAISRARLEVSDVASSAATNPQRNSEKSKLPSLAGRHFPGVPHSRSGLPLDGDVFIATSVEEQAWLDRNGYPNSKQLQAYANASDAMLAAAASDGDRVAKVILDGRRLIAGDLDASTSLWDAAVDGSGFALGTLAGYFGGSQKDGDPKSAYALSRVAEMRGDYRQALSRDLLVRKPLTPTERLEAESQAMKLFQELSSARRGRYGPNVSLVDPRPISQNGP